MSSETYSSIANILVCLDCSVVEPGGRLTANRWDGEQVLEKERFLWIEQED
jgi:hypothetical protein